MDILQAKACRDPLGKYCLSGAELPDQKYDLVTLKIFSQLSSQAKVSCSECVAYIFSLCFELFIVE